jgi:hypothetical protein
VTLDARARASAQAIRRSRTRLDPVTGLEDLLRRQHRRRITRAATALATATALALVAWVGVRGSERVMPIVNPPPGSLGRVAATIAVGRSPVDVLVSRDAVWVANAAQGTVSRIDPATNRPIVIDADWELVDGGLAVAGGRVWLSGRAYPGVQPIVRVDPATNRRADTIPTAAEGALGAGGGSVWHASSVTQSIYRLDPRAGRTLAEIPIGVVAKHLTVDAQSLWVGSDSGRVTRIDMATNTVTGTFQVSGRAPAVAVGYRAAWIVDTAHAALLRVQPGLAPQRHRVIGAGRWQRQQTWASSHAPAALARPSPASLAVAVAP